MRFARLGIALLTAVVGLTACSSSHAHTATGSQAFHWAGTSIIAGSQGGVKRNQPYIVSAGALCVESSQHPATVTGVTLRHPQGSMRIIDWGFRFRYPGDPWMSGWKDPGAAPGLLSDLPGFSKAPVAVPCRHTRNEAEFDVNVELVSGKLAITHGFWVHYTVDGVSGRALAPFTLGLCRAKCPKIKP